MSERARRIASALNAPIEEYGLHKAEPDANDEYVCGICNLRIKRVPGGQGTTYVHVDSGAVVGRTPK